jgi:hypothetical protein
VGAGSGLGCRPRLGGGVRSRVGGRLGDGIGGAPPPLLPGDSMTVAVDRHDKGETKWAVAVPLGMVSMTTNGAR